ncbi:unnamed protein product [Ectocarpus sp. CCAP 1310/34]|nr:unnamed protein product [Ectocarpus sp. CCAP 1310/34]
MSRADQERGARRAEDEDARINELVEMRVQQRLADMRRQQDEEEQRTENVRTGSEHETRHQQQAGRPSANPAVDDIARTLADALTSRLQISPADTGRVPSSAATLRMTEVKRLAPWDGMYRQGEDEQERFSIFPSNMIAMFAQEGVREVVLSDHIIPVGLEGIDMEDLRRMHSPDSVEKAITAWNMLITSV